MDCLKNSSNNFIDFINVNVKNMQVLKKKKYKCPLKNITVLVQHKKKNNFEY